MKLHEFITVILLILLSLGAGYAGGIKAANDRAPEAGQKIVIMDTMSIALSVPLDDPNRERKIREKAMKAQDMAANYAAQGYIVIDGKNVLRAPAALMLKP